MIKLYTGDRPIYAWTDGVVFEDEAKKQLLELSTLPIIHDHIAVMPDVHAGKGSTVGSVVPTIGGIIPATVGVDIGCGMLALPLSLTASDLPDNLDALRADIEAAVPHGSPGPIGNWANTPSDVAWAWGTFQSRFDTLCQIAPHLKESKPWLQLGTLGGGNHFIELCLDQSNRVWVMLHSGSRGIGNKIGTHFISQAKQYCDSKGIKVPNPDLSYLEDGTDLFDNYTYALLFAQEYAQANRLSMLSSVLAALRNTLTRSFEVHPGIVHCHHNYVAKEHHYGSDCWVTRKGAVYAGRGAYGIIPGSMGAKSFIVRGLGHDESFCSCSHGAGRSMSRTKAKKTFTVEQHAAATAGVSCRKDAAVVDETPAAYKDIDAVMAAQSDLVEIVYTLKQVLCVKG